MFPTFWFSIIKIGDLNNFTLEQTKTMKTENNSLIAIFSLV